MVRFDRDPPPPRQPVFIQSVDASGNKIWLRRESIDTIREVDSALELGDLKGPFIEIAFRGGYRTILQSTSEAFGNLYFGTSPEVPNSGE